MSRYSIARDNVTNRLTARGLPFELISYDESNTLIVLDDSAYGIMSALTEDDIVGELRERITSSILCSVGSIEPTDELYIRFDNTLYNIEKVEIIKPTDVVIAYKVYVGH